MHHMFGCLFVINQNNMKFIETVELFFKYLLMPEAT